MNSSSTIGIVAGMPRAGTTFLYYYLSQHPQIFASPRKEINYYSVYYSRGLDWYLSLFKGISDDQIGIDASPFYYLDEESIKRIATDTPSSKVILGLRTPSEMVCAMYERISSSTPNMPLFEDFIENYHWDIGDGLTLSLKAFPFSDRIKEFQQAFSDRLLLYSFKALNENPLMVLQRVEQHLGLSAYFNAENFSNRIINASKRRNSKYLSYFLKNESLIDLMIKVLPRHTINQARELFLKASKPHKTTKPPMNSQHLKLAKSYLAHEDKKVNAIFTSEQFVLGSEATIL